MIQSKTFLIKQLFYKICTRIYYKIVMYYICVHINLA